MKQKVLGEQWNTRMLTKAGNTRSSDEKQKAASLWILSMTVGIMGIKHSINALSLSVVLNHDCQETPLSSLKTNRFI